MRAEKYFGTGTVAKLLGLSVGTVQKLVDNGKLQAYSTEGGHRRVSYSDLLKYKEGQLMKPNGIYPNLNYLDDPKKNTVGIIYSAKLASNNIMELTQNPRYCLISDPTQLLLCDRTLNQYFIDARVTWMTWKYFEEFSDSNIDIIVYQSHALSPLEKEHLKKMVTLFESDISLALLEGYQLAHIYKF